MSKFRNVFIVLVMGSGLAHAASAQATGVQLALTPASTVAPLESEFMIELTVPTASSPFNAFDAVVEYDPAVLTFLPETPSSLQEGSLVTNSCGNTFHRFLPAADSLVITDVLLCAGQSMTGPGQIYRLRFRAGSTPGSTWIRLRFPRTRFYNAGLFVLPVTTSDAEVVVGDPLDAGAPRAGVALALRAVPNPARSGALLRIGSDRAGAQRVSIHDARGRLVRKFAPSEEAAGERNLWWDGRDQAGQHVVAGQYSIVVRLGERRASGHVTLLN